MKKTVLSVFLFFLMTAHLSAKVWTVTNSGSNFSPATLTVASNDTIVFTLGGIHNAQEVSQSTYNANGITTIAGGFITNFGGGTVLAANLSVGIHYYVCANHGPMGMKGTITVQSATGIAEHHEKNVFSAYPNPTQGKIQVPVLSKSNGAMQLYLVYSTAGKLLQAVQSADGNLNLSTLPAGSYVLETSVDKKVYSTTIVKQ